MSHSQIGGIALGVGGLLGAIYALVYTLWSGVSALYQLSGLTYIISFLADGDLGLIISTLVGLLVPIVQVVGFLLLFVLAGLAIYGGVVLYRGGPKGRVLLGAASAVALPVVGILVNYLGILGELAKATTDLGWALQSAMWELVAGSAYNVPSFALLAIELVLAAAAAWLVTRPGYGEAGGE